MAAYNICLQVTFILVQILFVAFGVVMIGVGAWLEVQERSVVAAIETETFLVGPYLIIAAGCAVLLVAAIGLIGALCDKKINRFLLIFYIVLVIIVFAAQLAGGILGFVFRDAVTTLVQDGLNTTLNLYDTTADTDSVNGAVTESWDFVQNTLECCGLESVLDWTDRNLTNFENGGAFPQSCCVMSTITCNTDPTDPNIHQNGCVDVLTNFVRDQLLVVAAIAIAFVVGEIVVVLMAFCLVCCTDFDD